MRESTYGGMYVILSTSILALALFAERAYYLYIRLGLDIDKAYKRVQYRVENENYQQAFEPLSSRTASANQYLGNSMRMV